MTTFDVFRSIHIAAGFSALSSFWIPMVVTKGGSLHRRAGWFYVCAMATVAVSAVIMATIRLFFQDGNSDGRKVFSIFLLFIAVLSSSSAWFGIRVLQQKKRVGVHSELADVAWSTALLLASVATIVLGFHLDVALLKYFPALGLFVSVNQLLYWRRAPREKAHWWFKHMSGMFASCIATVTAFSVFGGPRFLGISGTSLWLWFTPTAVLVPVLLYWSRRYRQKFGKRSATA